MIVSSLRENEILCRSEPVIAEPKNASDASMKHVLRRFSSFPRTSDARKRSFERSSTPSLPNSTLRWHLAPSFL